MISFQAALTPIAATFLAVGSLPIATELGLTDPYTPSLPVALFVLGNGLGPLYLAPLSEIYGRRKIYLSCFTLFAIFNVGCALSPDIVSLSILRFCSGTAGSAASTLGAASVGDMFLPADRALAQAIYGSFPLLGPVLGGILGGYIVAGTGSWRWLMWIMVIAPAVTVLTCYLLLRETYAPFLQRKHENKTWNVYQDEKGLRTGRLFKNAILRPLRLLLLSPVCLIMSVVTGL